MQSIAAIAIVSVVWVLAGYTLAFGPDIGGVIGGLAHLGFRGVGEAPHALAPTVPHTAFAAFQMMFAVITPALIAGAFAERVRFGGYVAFVALWSLSETPVAEREPWIEAIDGAAAALLAYQHEFEGADNRAWFADLRVRAPHLRWTFAGIAHLPGNSYAIGRR